MNSNSSFEEKAIQDLMEKLKEQQSKMNSYGAALTVEKQKRQNSEKALKFAQQRLKDLEDENEQYRIKIITNRTSTNVMSQECEDDARLDEYKHELERIREMKNDDEMRMWKALQSYKEKCEQLQQELYAEREKYTIAKYG
ncbi:MAG: hypothetical protein EZS28_003208 [Streblomastix strix]|uniref:Uncharacterized protein n=1 Tax=Streblomastix strix TaxID=222440 RepID=A0A5J4X269_9EUKA|nr:MAG: hypothetical protein EZS28_003208 [Streblomastix strix]